MYKVVSQVTITQTVSLPKASHKKYTIKNTNK